MAEGYCQHGCHGAVPDLHPLSNDATKKEDIWENPAAHGISYYTPLQDVVPGSARDVASAPLLFKPLTVRDMEIPNRIMLSPMCQYSADDGHMTMWHYTHLGGIIQRGPGLVMVEATAITPEVLDRKGRITPQCCGIWKDSQGDALRRIVEFSHSQGVKIGIQLGHAGRKGSTVAPWVHRKAVASKQVGGWPDEVISVTDQPFNEHTYVPRQVTLGDLIKLKHAWNAAVLRALAAGVDTLEVHAAHGYLLESFLSPASNTRVDEYGGNFENRIRLLVEIVEATRKLIPLSMPLLVRIPGTDWLEHLGSAEDVPHWDVAQAIRLSVVLAERGVDWIEVTTGGLDLRQKIDAKPGYQVPYAAAVKQGLLEHGWCNVVVSTVGMVTEAQQARQITEDGLADVVAVGRAFLKNPGLVWDWAEVLKVPLYHANQIGWGFGITKNHYPGGKGGDVKSVV